MLVLLNKMYYTSSTECTKIRIDRYRACVGPNNEQQTLVKIIQWKDSPILYVDSDKMYVAELRFSTYANRDKEYINHDIIYFGEYADGRPIDCLYAYVLYKTDKATPIRPKEFRSKPLETITIGNKVEDDGLPF